MSAATSLPHPVIFVPAIVLFNLKQICPPSSSSTFIKKMEEYRIRSIEVKTPFGLYNEITGEFREVYKTLLP